LSRGDLWKAGLGRTTGNLCPEAGGGRPLDGDDILEAPHARCGIGAQIQPGRPLNALQNHRPPVVIGRLFGARRGGEEDEAFDRTVCQVGAFTEACHGEGAVTGDVEAPHELAALGFGGVCRPFEILSRGDQAAASRVGTLEATSP